ncbi:MAG: hypothetical protein MJZ21_05420, partial [archaeon]|nr:hypothetical protein [archaeon]
TTQSTGPSCIFSTPATYTDAKMWVLGNADGDMDIDANDITVIDANIGKDVKTAPMCDANHDNAITAEDKTFVQSMIDGTATHVYYYNVDGKICDFKIYKNINMVALHRCVVRSTTILANSGDNVKLVGMDSGPYKEAEFGVSKGIYGSIEDVGVLKDLSSENFGTLQSKYMNDPDTCLVICLGTVNNYLTDLESWAAVKDYQVVRFGTWEGSTIEGLLTTGYLFSGVGNPATGGTCWDQALAYGTWAHKYLDLITAESSKIAEKDRLKALCIYTNGDHWKRDGHTTRGIGSGDMENTVLAGANNIAARFGTSSGVTFSMEEAATYCKDVDVIISMTFNSYTAPDAKVSEEIKSAYDIFNGYVQKDCKFYGMTWALNGAPYIVQMLYYAQVFMPNSTALSAYAMEQVYGEYLKLMGWDARTDISFDISNVCSPVDKPMVFDKDPNGDDGFDIDMKYIAIGAVAILAILGVAIFIVKKH